MQERMMAEAEADYQESRKGTYHQQLTMLLLISL